MTRHLIANVTCVAVEGRGILIEGPPGSGKSTLALELLDRGAVLVGDDGIACDVRAGRVWASPHPEIAGLVEIRGVGIATVPTSSAPLSLVLALGRDGERLPQPVEVTRFGIALPMLSFATGLGSGLRAEWALRLHGLPLPGAG